MHGSRGINFGRILLVLLAASPAVMPIYLILRFGIDVPYQDQCAPGVAGLFVKAHNGQLHITDLFAQQNEHRIVVPRIIFLLLGWLSHWNTICEMFAVWVIVCMTSAGIFLLIRRTQSSTSSPLFPWFLCNLLLFSPAAQENWLWGMGVQFVLPPAFLIAALLVVQLNIIPWGRCVVAAVLCTAATFSAGNGILAWPLIGVALAWSGSREELKSKRWMLLGWIAACILCVVLYSIHYQFPAQPASAEGAGQMTHRIQYGLIFLGAPLAGVVVMHDDVILATILGAVMLALLLVAAVCLLRRWQRRLDRDLFVRMLPWLMLAGFAVISGVIGSILRSHLPLIQATSSRYAPYSSCLCLGLINLAPIVCGEFRRIRWLPALLGFTLAGLLALGISPLIQFAKLGTGIRANWKAAVLMSQLLPDNSTLEASARSDLPRFLSDLRVLNAMGYIHPPVIPDRDARAIEEKSPGGSDNLLADGKLEHAGSLPGSTDRAVMAGWAISPRARPADSVFLTYEDENRRQIIFALADIGGEREDIATARGREFLRCGWGAVFPVAALPKYMRVVKITAWALDTQSRKAVRLEGALTTTPP